MKGYKIVLIILIVTTTGFSQYDTSCGIVWEPPIQLSPDSTVGYVPSIAVQGDTVHVTWWNSGLHFPYVRSTDGGKTFEPLRELAPDSVGHVSDCYIFSAANRLHTIFAAQKVNGTPYFVYHMLSFDRGNTWSMPYKFNDTLIYYSSTSTGDTIIFRSSRPDQFYLLTKSLDGGITWHTDTCNELIGNHPQLALTKDYLHLVKGAGFDSAGIWSEFVIQYRRSTDLGKTWSDSIPLSTIYGTTAWDPYISTYELGDSSKIFTAWRDTKYGCLTMVGCAILGRRSNDNGTSFFPEERFDERPAGFEPHIDIEANIQAIIWTDDLPDGGVVIRVSTDNGKTFCPTFAISTGLDPDVKISKNIIHLVWEQLKQYPDSSYKFQIYYRRGVILPTYIHENFYGPLSFYLNQNYPNPFNSKTIIKYKIPSTEYVSIKVYDVFGTEVTTLVNEKKTMGEYEVEWNAENVSSGVYYYRLNSGKYHAVGKAILLK